MGSKSPTLLIDGDLVLHKVLAAIETDVDWGDGVSSIFSNHKDCQEVIRGMIRGWCTMFGTKNIRIALTGSTNFRKDLYSDYKGNRTTRKPVGWKPMKDWLFAKGNARSVAGIEADDLIGIWATQGKLNDPIIISDDKDFRSIPGSLFVPRSNELVSTTLEGADRYHLHQTLVGDRADNYKGCPGIGDVKAGAILRTDTGEPGELWGRVVECFLAAGLTEEDALLQARLARILRAEDFDFKTRKPILWRPE